MKNFSKIALSLAAALSMASASVSLSTPQASNSQSDPFAQMEHVFQMQMKQMRAMQQQMDKLFQNFQKSLPSSSNLSASMPIQSAGIFSSGFQDRGDHYELTLKVDDLKHAQVNISTDNRMLTIEVQEKRKVEKQQGNYGKVISYANSSAVESFTLPDDADPSTIKATQKGNAIIITIAKKKATKVIPIQKENSGKSSAAPANKKDDQSKN